ncbi:hypothetical protein ACH4E5_11100 [Streptomyces afghaniensis]|uniref:hypothetical protein n=1 Tax=Streptomyces afghaniensis TaxID=66865 RepID=UPI0037AA4484
MDTEIESRFRTAGLEVIGQPEVDGGPSVEQAFRRVVHIDAEPVERIQRNTADAPGRLDEAWRARARAGGVLSEDGTCLVAAGMKGGWVHVRLTEDSDISALRSPDGDLLLIARSPSGHRVCAASTEGGDYWILEEDFPGPA